MILTKKENNKNYSQCAHPKSELLSGSGITRSMVIPGPIVEIPVAGVWGLTAPRR